MIAFPENVAKFTWAACCLHNFLITNDESNYAHKSYVDHFGCDGQIIPGAWRSEEDDEDNSVLKDMAAVGGGNRKRNAKLVRTELKRYYNEVPWQLNQVLYTGQLSD